MAKTGVSDTDPELMTKETELKKELKKLVSNILDCDDYGVLILDQAREVLSTLKDLKITKKSLSLKLPEAVSCPDEFRCPISGKLMKDPVVLASGQTYDRPFIQQWLKAGNKTCPTTNQVLSHTLLTPNHLIKEMISQWCRSQGIQLRSNVNPVGDDGVAETERDKLLSLLKKMSTTNVTEQKVAARELRSLTKRMPSFRALFGESRDAIPQLLTPFSEHKSQTRCDPIQPELQEDVITTLLNLSIHDSNKKLVGETPKVISFLMEALRSGTIESRSNAAATLFTLSALDSNKSIIGKSGALKPLIDLLEEGHPLAMKDVASALFNLCINHENKGRAVRDGAVKVILEKIMAGVRVDELLAILAMLSNHPMAVEEMAEHGAVPFLLSLIRDSSCDRNNENCISMLHMIIFSDRTKWKEIREEENTNRTISKLSQNGTSRAKRKANGILDRLKRSANITHTA